MKINYNDNPQILNQFLNYLLAIKNYSINTVKAYNIDLMQFITFIKDYMNFDVEVKDVTIFLLLKVDRSDIYAFLINCNYSRDNNPYTRQRKLSAIRRFYKWMLANFPTGNYMVNPTKYIENILPVQRIPKYLTLEQAKKIQEIFTLENSKFYIRNNTIISLFLSTGIRVGELINISIRDINFKNNSIIIYGKGNKERTVYFSNYCKKQLKKYIDFRNRNEKIININEPLFVNYRHERVGIDCIEDICEKAYELMGLADMGYTTHTLRHTAATLIYIYVKQDILLLKEFLGHASVSTTEIYTHVFNKKVKEAVDKNPLNDFDFVKKAA